MVDGQIEFHPISSLDDYPLAKAMRARERLARNVEASEPIVSLPRLTKASTAEKLPAWASIQKRTTLDRP